MYRLDWGIVNQIDLEKIDKDCFCLEVEFDVIDTLERQMTFGFLFCNIEGLKQYFLNNCSEKQYFLHFESIFINKVYSFEELQKIISSVEVIVKLEKKDMLFRLNSKFKYKHD